jgi:hypothetical protein
MADGIVETTNDPLDPMARQTTDSVSGGLKVSGDNIVRDGAEPTTFTLNQTRVQFEANKVKLKTFGVNIDGDSGELVHDGVIVDFSYSEPTLTITEKKHPVFVSDGFVRGKILAWFSANDTSAVRSEKIADSVKATDETKKDFNESANEEWKRKK